jgi:hypothetical protein
MIGYSRDIVLRFGHRHHHYYDLQTASFLFVPQLPLLLTLGKCPLLAGGRMLCSLQLSLETECSAHYNCNWRQNALLTTIVIGDRMLCSLQLSLETECSAHYSCYGDSFTLWRRSVLPVRYELDCKYCYK